jgi:hypothetical protein
MLTEEQLKQFDKDGYIVLKHFYNSDQCTRMYQEAGKIVANVIKSGELEKIPMYPYVSKGSEPTIEDFDYFEESAHDAKLFLNKKVFAADSNVDPDAKAKVIRNKVNRIGHALHAVNQTFKEITFTQEVKDVVKSIGFSKPVVLQSMYLMLESSSDQGHQTSTYVIVEPSKLVSFWAAVTECTEDNGCLEIIPGSHKKGGLKNKFIRNPNKQEYDAGKRYIYTEGNPQYPEEGFVKVPLEAGDVVLIDGFVVHRASPCKVTEPCNTYAFHCYDSDKADFSEDNWMTYDENTFLPLY